MVETEIVNHLHEAGNGNVVRKNVISISRFILLPKERLTDLKNARG